MVARKQGNKRSPTDDAVTRGSPAVVLLCARWSRVLGLNGYDAVRERLQLSGGVGTCPGDPPAIDFELHCVQVSRLAQCLAPHFQTLEALSQLRRSSSSHGSKGMMGSQEPPQLLAAQSNSKIQLDTVQPRPEGQNSLKILSFGEQGSSAGQKSTIVLAATQSTGKTSFAAVLAATLEVPLSATSVAEWSAQNYLLETLKRMQAVFDEAPAKAPRVLFIGEPDGISSRSAIEGRYSEFRTQIVNHLLELTTEALGKEGVVIVCATNHPDRIDPALTNLAVTRDRAL